MQSIQKRMMNLVAKLVTSIIDILQRTKQASDIYLTCREIDKAGWPVPTSTLFTSICSQGCAEQK